MVEVQRIDAEALIALAERRSRALAAILGLGPCRGSGALQGRAGDAVLLHPYVVVEAQAQAADHACAPDCPHWAAA